MNLILAILSISIKFFFNFSLSILILSIKGVSFLISHEHFAFLLTLSYPTKSQFSSHNVKLLSINSFLLSFKHISKPLFDFVG